MGRTAASPRMVAREALPKAHARCRERRLLRGVEGTYSYNLYSVSRADLERIQELHRAYFRELRRIVADSQPSECIALATVHLLELGPTTCP